MDISSWCIGQPIVAEVGCRLNDDRGVVNSHFIHEETKAQNGELFIRGGDEFAPMCLAPKFMILNHCTALSLGLGDHFGYGYVCVELDKKLLEC